VILPALIAAIHYLALAIGFFGVVVRGLGLRRLRRSPQDLEALGGMLRADNAWGVASLLWITTGLWRVFGRVEKAPEFYLRNGFFFLKMGLFLLVFAQEILPMVTFIRWRIARGRGAALAIEPALGRLIGLNDLEVALILLIPFAATLMARGVWLF
jgi:putative membrane protein